MLVPQPAPPAPGHLQSVNPELASPGTSIDASWKSVYQHPHEPSTNTQPTSDSRFESAGSDWLNQPLTEKTLCSGVSRSGHPCRAYAHGGSLFCIFHDPAYREAQRANSRLGGRRSGEARSERGADLVPIDISTPRARVDVLGYMLAATLEGRLSNGQSAVVSRILELASRTAKDEGGIDPEVLRQFFGSRR